MANNKITYTLDFRANLTDIQGQLNKLRNSLQAVAKMPLMGKVDPKNKAALDQASQSALILQQHLQKAVNTNTGRLDLTKFNMSLTKSGYNLKALSQDLVKVGPKGQEAFMQLSLSIANSQRSMMQLTGMADKFLTTLKNTARWQLSSFMLTGLISGFSNALNFVKDLNKSLNDIRIVSGDSADQMARYAKEANAAAKALGATTLDVTDATLIYRQQGDSLAQAAKKAEITIKAANVATEASAEEMSSYLTAIWNSYKVGSEEMELYVDKLSKVGAITAVNMSELATASEKVAATANTVGVSYDQLLATISTVGSVTRQSAETIGTAFKTIYARIGDLKIDGESIDEDGVAIKLGDVSSQLHTVGINILDANNNMKDMGTIVEDIGGKWQVMTEAEKQAVAQVIAGKRQYTHVMALFENWEYYKNVLEETADAQGTLNDQNKIFAESWEAASNRVKTAWQDAIISLNTEDALVGLINNFGTLIDIIADATKGMGGLKGILLMLGSVAMKVYGTAMVNGLKNVAMHTKMAFMNKEQYNAALVKEQQATFDTLADEMKLSKEYRDQMGVVFSLTKAMSTLNQRRNEINPDKFSIYTSFLQMLEAELNEAISKYNTLQSEQKEYENALASGTLTSQMAKNAGVSLTPKQLEALNTELGECQGNLSGLLSGITTIDDLSKDDIEKLANYFTELKNKVEDAKNSIPGIGKKIEEVNGNITKEKIDPSAQFAQTVSAFMSISMIVTQLQSTISLMFDETASGADKATAALTNLPMLLLSATSAVNALKTAFAGLSTGLSWGIVGGVTAAISALVWGIKKFDELHISAEEAEENLKDLKSEYESIKSDVDDKTKTIDKIESLKKEYEVLADLHRISSLTAEEQERLDSITSELTDTYGINLTSLNSLTDGYEKNKAAIEAEVEALRKERVANEENLMENRKETIKNLRSQKWDKYYETQGSELDDVARRIDINSAHIDSDYFYLLKEQLDNIKGLEYDYTNGFLSLTSDDDTALEKARSAINETIGQIHQMVRDEYNNEIAPKFNNQAADAFLDMVEFQTIDILDEKNFDYMGNVISNYFKTSTTEYAKNRLWTDYGNTQFLGELQKFSEEYKDTIDIVTSGKQQLEQQYSAGIMNDSLYDQYYQNIQNEMELLDIMVQENIIDADAAKAMKEDLSDAINSTNDLALKLNLIQRQYTDAPEGFKDFTNDIVEFQKQLQRGEITFDSYINSINEKIATVDMNEIFNLDDEGNIDLKDDFNKDVIASFYQMGNELSNTLLQGFNSSNNDLSNEFLSRLDNVVDYYENIGETLGNMDLSDPVKKLVENSVESLGELKDEMRRLDGLLDSFRAKTDISTEEINKTLVDAGVTFNDLAAVSKHTFSTVDGSAQMTIDDLGKLEISHDEAVDAIERRQKVLMAESMESMANVMDSFASKLHDTTITITQSTDKSGNLIYQLDMQTNGGSSNLDSGTIQTYSKEKGLDSYAVKMVTKGYTFSEAYAEWARNQNKKYGTNYNEKVYDENNSEAHKFMADFKKAQGSTSAGVAAYVRALNSSTDSGTQTTGLQGSELDKYIEDLNKVYDKISDTKNKIAEKSKDLADAWDEEYLARLQDDLTKHQAIIDEYQKQIDTVDWFKNFLPEGGIEEIKNVYSEYDLLNKQVLASQNEYNRLKTLKPRNAEEAEEIYNQMQSLSESIKDGTLKMYELSDDLKNIEFSIVNNLVTTFADDMTKEFDHIKKLTDAMLNDVTTDKEYENILKDRLTPVQVRKDIENAKDKKEKEAKEILKIQKKTDKELLDMNKEVLDKKSKEAAEDRAEERSKIQREIQELQEELETAQTELSTMITKADQNNLSSIILNHKSTTKELKGFWKEVVDVMENASLPDDKKKQEYKIIVENVGNKGGGSEKSSPLDNVSQKGSYPYNVSKYKNTEVTANFKDKGKYWKDYHHGTDFNLPGGAELLAVTDGEVVTVQEGNKWYGSTIEIQDKNGYRIRYAHMKNGLSIKAGTQVKKGDIIGRVGVKDSDYLGNAFGSHLHLEVKDPGGTNIDPLSYISKYAEGTDKHPGGLAMVGDERKGAYEAIITPDGDVTIAGENGAEILDLPKGTEVLSHTDTKKLLKSIPKYKNGTSNLEKATKQITGLGAAGEELIVVNGKVYLVGKNGKIIHSFDGQNPTKEIQSAILKDKGTSRQNLAMHVGSMSLDKMKSANKKRENETDEEFNQRIIEQFNTALENVYYESVTSQYLMGSLKIQDLVRIGTVKDNSINHHRLLQANARNYANNAKAYAIGLKDQANLMLMTAKKNGTLTSETYEKYNEMMDQAETFAKEGAEALDNANQSLYNAITKEYEDSPFKAYQMIELVFKDIEDGQKYIKEARENYIKYLKTENEDWIRFNNNISAENEKRNESLDDSISLLSETPGNFKKLGELYSNKGDTLVNLLGDYQTQLNNEKSQYMATFYNLKNTLLKDFNLGMPTDDFIAKTYLWFDEEGNQSKLFKSFISGQSEFNKELWLDVWNQLQPLYKAQLDTNDNITNTKKDIDKNTVNTIKANGKNAEDIYNQIKATDFQDPLAKQQAVNEAYQDYMSEWAENNKKFTDNIQRTIDDALEDNKELEKSIDNFSEQKSTYESLGELLGSQSTEILDDLDTIDAGIMDNTNKLIGSFSKIKNYGIDGTNQLIFGSNKGQIQLRNLEDFLKFYNKDGSLSTYADSVFEKLSKDDAKDLKNFLETQSPNVQTYYGLQNQREEQIDSYNDTQLKREDTFISGVKEGIEINTENIDIKKEDMAKKSDFNASDLITMVDKNIADKKGLRDILINQFKYRENSPEVRALDQEIRNDEARKIELLQQDYDDEIADLDFKTNMELNKKDLGMEVNYPEIISLQNEKYDTTATLIATLLANGYEWESELVQKYVQELESIKIDAYNKYTEMYQQELDKVNEIKEQVTYINEQEIKSIEESISKQESLIDLDKKHNDSMKELRDTQFEINQELLNSRSSMQWLDRKTRDMLFNQEDYYKITQKISENQTFLEDLHIEYQEKIANLGKYEIDQANLLTEEYEAQVAAKKEELEMLKATLQIESKRNALNNALMERNVRVFAGGRWRQVANQEEVNQAYQEYSQSVHEANEKNIEHNENTLIREQEDAVRQLEFLKDSYQNQIDMMNDAIARLEHEWNVANSIVHDLGTVTFQDFKDGLADVNAVMSNVITASEFLKNKDINFGTYKPSYIGKDIQSTPFTAPDTTTISTDGSSKIIKNTNVQISSRDFESSLDNSYQSTASIPGIGEIPITIKNGKVTNSGLPENTIVHTKGGDYKITGTTAGGYLSEKIEKNAKGTRDARGGISQINELGVELLATNSGQFIELNPHEKIFNNDQMNFLYDFSRRGIEANNRTISSMNNYIEDTMNIENVTVQLPNVTDTNSFVEGLKNLKEYVRNTNTIKRR